MKTTTFTNPSKKRFKARLIEKGDRYGRNNCLVHDESKPLIQFFFFINPDFENMVSSYYAKTLCEIESGRGLRLDGGVPEWDISANNLEHTLAELL